MKTTSLDIREYKLKKKTFGYDVKDVEAMREIAADALTEATKEVNKLTEKLGRVKTKLYGHEEREDILKKTITTAHKMAEGLKGSASKEAAIIIAESKLKAESIIMQANRRVADIQNELQQYKRQRIELERSIKSVLDYHSNLLELGAEESRKADEELDKLKFITK